MKMIRGTLKLALVLYICAALSGVYILSASARITPHEGDDDTMLITIEKGDTLWDLCQEHLKDPLQWRELSKYNDFTNPHLIYPGEKLRIPLAMAKEAVEIAQSDLDDLRDQLKEAKTALENEEALKEEALAEIEKLRKDLENLKKQLDELQAQLESAEKEDEQFAGLKKSQDEAIAGLKKAQDEAVAGLQKRIDEKADETKKEIESVKNELKATDEHITALQADVKTLLTQIEANQKTINEAIMILKNAQGVHEEPSTAKRALVFLTTAAAGIGWFAISMIGGRSGE